MQPQNAMRPPSPAEPSLLSAGRPRQHCDAFKFATRRLGIKDPFIYDTTTKRLKPLQPHVSEANAVLAASGRQSSI